MKKCIRNKHMKLWLKNLLQWILHTITQILAIVLFYGAVWGLAQNDALPGSPIFSLLLLMVLCNIGGRIATFLKLPPLLGFLLTGFMYRNFFFESYYEAIPPIWGKSLRTAALAIILLRAGLGLDPRVLKRWSFVCAKLAALPMLVEAISAGVVSKYLFALPWSYSFCLGFVFSALSPAVVVPSMLNLQKEGYDEQKGILTLIIASAAIDDILAITGASISVGIAMTEGDSTRMTLAIKIPAEIIAGLMFGIILGLICWYLPHPSKTLRTFYKITILTAGAFAANFISMELDCAAAGALACLSLAFVAAIKWRKEEDKNVSVVNFENHLWNVLQIFLFGLIGAEVSIDALKNHTGTAFEILFIGLGYRMVMTFVVLIKSGFNMKEKAFICLTWIPKATVQAAMAPLVLDFARSKHLREQFVHNGEMILTVCVLSIVVTAPIGAIAIKTFGPILLSKPQKLTDPEHQHQDHEEFSVTYSNGSVAGIEYSSSTSVNHI